MQAISKWSSTASTLNTGEMNSLLNSISMRLAVLKVLSLGRQNTKLLLACSSNNFFSLG